MEGVKVVARNRKARHDYEILDTFECGIVLRGSEVKSLRNAQVELKDAYADIQGGEVWLERAHIAPYGFSPGGGHDPERPRKLLLHRREIERLIGK
nr:SsrA-binding protein [Acidimicrobiia bacterium]